MAVVHNVLFALDQLLLLARRGGGRREGKRKREGAFTYFLLDNGAKTGDPQQADAANLVHPQALAAEHGLANALALVLLDDALGAGEKAVVADRPGTLAVQADAGDVAQHRRAQEQLARSRKRGRADLGAGHELLHRELVRTLERDGRGHGNHDACKS